MPPIDSRELLAVFGGGFAGALARYGTEQALPADPGHWPWGTLAVNIVGAFVLGFVATRLQERLPLSAYRRPLLATGFCGALTTFSTLQLELLRMLDAGELGLALAYVVVSVTAGFAAVLLATKLVRRVRVAA